MEKIKINNNTFAYPMPVILVGSVVEGKVNFMTAAWFTAVAFEPPLLAIALGSHYTTKGIEKEKFFSINIPDVSLLEKTDYCGLVSGNKKDKSNIFEVFYGSSKSAPLIKECPICMACKLYETTQLSSATLYIGEIIETYSEERYMTDGKADIQKINPFILSVSDSSYRDIGNNVGKAWNAGKKLQ